ncbi:Gfo/Idh/MocA family oxidoreductase [Nonomuraea sp. NPDC001636]|uniref:Gfo/Idh/MocA family protein n=1 Tax=Nonomuraea sp. NPDC001636 TaxID=3154391 RepID=UPI00332CE642
MSDLRIAVIGAGQRVSIAREAHRPGRGARITAVCDLDPARLAHARTLFGDDVRTTTRLEEALDADAVIVATPDHLHAEHAIAVLGAGLPTFVEKPLATTVEDADRVLEAARAHAARLYVGHNMRHMPVVREMRSLIGRGAIGEVTAVWCRHFVGHGGDYYFKDWHADRRCTTGLLLQKGAHDLDVIHWLAGSRTGLVTAMGALGVYDRVEDRSPGLDEHWFDPGRNWPPLSQRGLNPVIDVEDLSMVLMRLDNGVQASYQQCHYTPDYWRNYTVIGTEGRLENFGDHRGTGVVRVWNKRRRDYDADGDLVVTVPAVPEAEGGHGGADRALMTEFLRFAREGGSTDTSPVAARDAVAAAYHATLSLRSGSTPRAVPPVRPEVAAYFAT